MLIQVRIYARRLLEIHGICHVHGMPMMDTVNLPDPMTFLKLTQDQNVILQEACGEKNSIAKARSRSKIPGVR